jgi:hypothetical protein
MKAEIKDSRLTIGLLDLIETLSEADRAEVARYLCASAVLMKAVLDNVVKGEFFEEDERGTWWFDRRELLELREKLIPVLPDVAAKIAAEALHQRDQAVAEKERHERWAWKMYHAWPKTYWRDQPDIEAFEPLTRPPGPR